MNIDDKSQIRECTSCQMCGAVCPTSAISIILDKEGFYRPVIDTEKCIDCSRCVKSCYKFDNEILLTDSLQNKKLLSAWVEDRKILDKTTSGGIGDILAKEFIKQGFVCIGVKYNCDKNIAEGYVAAMEEECDCFRSSKYIQSRSVEAFKQLVKEHRKQKFAVFGLPCQIYAIDRFLKSMNNREPHILIDLYCHGCPTLTIWKKYLSDEVKVKPNEKVTYVNFRSKVRGWGEFNIEVKLSDGCNLRTFISPKINDSFYGLFFSDILLNGACPTCALRSTLEYTDLRLGDFWGKKFIDNTTGVSALSICSRMGMKVYENLFDKGELIQQNWNSFLPYQSYGKVYLVNLALRNKILNLLTDDTLPIRKVYYAYLNSLPLSIRMRHILKNIIKSLPKRGMKVIKKAYQKLKY